MQQRGVTRPAMTGPGDDRRRQDSHPDAVHQSHAMSDEQRVEMLRMHHQQTLWVYWSVILLGLWTVASPFTLGYQNDALWVVPSGGRGVWFSDALFLEFRAALMTWSDVGSGLLLVVFGWRALTPNRPVSVWICCGIGVWLSLAPVVLWAPTASAYLNGTSVGALVIALTVLIPGMPNMMRYMRMGGSTPPGWSYNPSSWPQRAVLIALAFVGWLVSRHLAAYQLGYVDEVVEPFFGEGSRRVLNSQLSHAWPVSDGALGAFAYTFEFLMGWMGSPARWRTMPWMVTFFGILVIPLGLVHIFLVISQPVTVGEWCTFCLLAAALMLPMIPLQVDEVVAMGQHLVKSRRAGESLWRAFWKGGPAEGSLEDERTPDMNAVPGEPGRVAAASLWGVSVPWTLALSTALGAWLMFVPTIVGLEGRASDVSHLGGALVIVTSIIAMGEPVRLFRYANVLLGIALAGAVLYFDAGLTAGVLNATVAGVLIAVLAFPRGPKTEAYGAWDTYVR